MKAAGRLRYVGITTSEGRRHAEIEQVMRSQPIDFVQLTYNLLDREAEQRLLPLAQERGIAVIVNRPFREGALLRQLAAPPRCRPGRREIDCDALGAGGAEVHRLAPGRDLRDSGHQPASRTCGRTWAPRAAACPTRRCAQRMARDVAAL